MEPDRPPLNEIYEWLDREIFRYVDLHERRGGASLSMLLLAFDPCGGSPRFTQIKQECPQWLLLKARDRSWVMRTRLNALVAEGRLKTTDDDVIHYLNKMLVDKHTPEPSYLPINVLDQMAERLRDDDHDR
jgi:hypothetical protein